MYSSLIDRIKKDDNDIAAHIELCVALATAGNLSGLNEILTYRNVRGHSGSALAFDTARHLLSAGQLDMVGRLCREVGDTSPFSAAFYCAGSFAHFLRFEHGQGLALLREGVRRLLILAARHPRETLSTLHQASVIQLAFLLEPLDWAPPENRRLNSR